jgi:hypothetical protein
MINILKLILFFTILKVERMTTEIFNISFFQNKKINKHWLLYNYICVNMSNYDQHHHPVFHNFKGRKNDH